MFNILVTASLRHRLIVLFVAALLVGYGMMMLPRVPMDVFPDLTKPIVTVQTEADGMAPQEVELLVTRHIETAMNGLPGVGRVRSVSGVGLSIVYVEFDWGTEIYRNRQLVTEKLGGIRDRLPRNAVASLGGINSIMGEIMLVALTGPKLSPMELREIADFTIRPQLLAIPGVAQVIPIGGEVRQFQISPSPVAMKTLGVTPETLEAAVRNFGMNFGGGFVDQHGSEFLIRNVGDAVDLQQLRNVAVAQHGGRTILLNEIADISFAPRVKRGEAGYNGAPSIIMSIQKMPTADTLPLTAAVEAELAALQRTLPDGVNATNIQFRQATFIERSIENVKSVLIEAAAVVAIVLVLFLLNWRATVISLTAIPISILVTVLVFSIFGLTINTMTLGGLAIAIGELVDDAVVDVENILRRLKNNSQLPQPLPAIQVIATASREVRSGIVYATFIIVLVFVPLFALSGVEGRLFTPLGVAYIVSILASLLTAITVTPVLSYYLLRNTRVSVHKDTAIVRELKAGNSSLLRWAFDHPRTVVLPIVGAVALASVGAALLPRAFLPPFNEGTLLVGMQYNPGISLAESHRLGFAAERLVMTVPEVKSVGRRTGRAELDSHAEGVHASELDIDLERSTRPKEAVFEDIREKLSVLPVSVALGQPISHRIDHMLSGVRAAIAIKIFGPDLDVLRTLADNLNTRLKAVRGLVDLNVEKQTLIPQIRVRATAENAAIYGLSPAQVTSAIEGLSNGRVVSQVSDGLRRFDVVVRLSDENRSTRALGDVLIPTPTGYVPLHYVASVDETVGPNQILRENGHRRILLFGNGDGVRDMAAIVEDVRRITSEMDLPSGYVIRVDGTFQAQEQATRTIALLSLVSLALIFLVLYSRYQSAVLSTIILMNIPLALIGSVVALWIAGQPLSVASMIGFITLAGITARNGILKISHYINLAVLEGETFGRELVIRGSLERLTPVLMTALAAGLALIPLLIGADQPGREILHPVAVTIFGGLVTATIIDTVLTPLLFLRFGRKPLEALVAERAAANTTAAIGNGVAEAY
ncbi:MAG: efflux RND transporter permease subunit [Hyphomicrobium sp.]|jgi:HME family heavy-metal exporter|uniref:efflux RND transporter permease subunit n=1 Tax=Hyphomicrobium sp. DMF-1 TaxID=3019544 RepID=UPI0022EC06BA|nr:efflux RND transporter permease subunit [Hyphomicrobium sp. DMF-1]WBT37945.1 efflux RND transporter permease subunit [Hyphomicrobium sp. DMF-1]